MEEKKIKISANGTEFSATLSNNSSGESFYNYLKKGPLTINMSDYGNFEKVGDLPQKFPTNDKQITTKPGDIILYLGNKITIYYGTNSWDFTLLGKIDNANQNELKQVLGKGNVNVTFST